MKCNDVINEIKSWASVEIDPTKTCDTIKCGDGEKEVSKIAISMFATPDVVNDAVNWGADMLIVHEPVYYEHMDKNIDSFIGEEKKKFLEKSGLTVFRFHDYAHAMNPDLIYEGEMKYLGLSGKCVKGKYFAVNNFILDNKMTAKEIAKTIQKNLQLKHVRIAGNPDAEGTKISCCFGTPGHLESELFENDFLLTGEICEWCIGEMARDYAQLGYNKAVIVMSHIGSERAGMMLLSEKMKSAFPALQIKYFECGEVYNYVD
ncbi:MAG: Nif3-like dinuclear metal center hexameric protein [Clostridia bacterium]|nr:Nif3-like dinuclear metal center hexameric protein [Clostridia bacterium]